MQHFHIFSLKSNSKSPKHRLFLITSLICTICLTGCGASKQVADTTQSGTDSSAVASSETETLDTSSATSESQTTNTIADIDTTPLEINDMVVSCTQKESADIYIDPIPNLPEDFMLGMDISSLLAEEASGVIYKNENGEPQDLLEVLAESGVNTVRVRVWNDPFDKDGNGYGGGNCDVKTAAIIGRRAAKCGINLVVDFHYSDFWADPAKQAAPKEWAHYFFDQKQEAMYTYTKESLQTILSSGAKISMVQIGNEINNGLAGETKEDNICALLKEASRAVREVSDTNGTPIKIAVHYTNIDDKNQLFKKADMLKNADVDYDVFGVSYYAYWHGTMTNLTEVLTKLAKEYDKEVAVLETSYAYTLEDGDGFANSVSETDLVDGYAATVQSQASCLRDVIAATSAAGPKAIGVFYWEGAWIPVGSASSYDSNLAKWEKDGSGWASSFSAKYDPKDAGIYYGGCSWDNQAMFDHDGKPLASLALFKYLRYGTECDKKVDFIPPTIININVGEEILLPETIEVVYNNRNLDGQTAVSWNASDYDTMDSKIMGDYEIHGTLDDGTDVTALLHIADVNWLLNPSFEETNMTMWNVEYKGETNPTDVQTKAADAVTGENSFHFWDESAQDFTISQDVTNLAAGSYRFTANLQGNDVGKDAKIFLFAKVGDKEYTSEPVTLNGWCNWQTPEITDIVVADGDTVTVGVSVTCAAKGWGTMDDLNLSKQ